MHEQPRQPDNPEQQRQLRPRIYVASLADDTNGHLVGSWVDANQPADALHDAVSAMLARSTTPGAEEWAIHDHDDFAGLRLSEYESLETVSLLAAGLAQHGEAFAAFATWSGTDAATPDGFEQHYRGCWPSVEAYAADLLDDLGADETLDALPEWLRPYVDLDTAGFGRDLELGGDIYTSDGHDGVHIFDAYE
jgi:antirestriction protein